jgi:hypothetical protein
MAKHLRRYKFEVTFLSAVWLCAGVAIIGGGLIGL